MKKLVKKLVLNLVFLILKVKRRVFHCDDIVFLCPDVPLTNLGDQALMLGCLEGLTRDFTGKIHILPGGPQEIKDVPGIDEFSGSIKIHQNLYPAFATENAFGERVKAFWLTGRTKRAVLVGADVLDGRYNPAEAARKLDFMKAVADIGVDARIVGFSLSENISDESKKSLSSLAGKVSLYARDALSRDRAKQFAPCELSADCAFLMEPVNWSSIRDESLKSWISGEHSIFAVCLRKQDLESKGTSDIVSSVASALVKVSQELNLSLLLLPHHPDDIEALRRLAASLQEKGFNQYCHIELLPTAREIKAIVSKCRHILTSRMHVSIASLGSGKPVTCIPYAGKFEGLYKHFGLEEASLERSRLHQTQYVYEKLLSRLNNSDQIAEIVQKSLQKVKKLSASNFE